MQLLHIWCQNPILRNAFWLQIYRRHLQNLCQWREPMFYQFFGRCFWWLFIELMTFFQTRICEIFHPSFSKICLDFFKWSKLKKKTFLNLEILVKTIGRFLFRKLVKTCYELNNCFVHQIKHPIMNLRFFCHENEFQIKVLMPFF